MKKCVCPITVGERPYVDGKCPVCRRRVSFGRLAESRELEEEKEYSSPFGDIPGGQLDGHP